MTNEFNVDDAIEAEFTVNSNQCQVCVWLTTLPENEANAWDAAMSKRTNPHRAVFRAMKKRGFPRGDGSVAGHRNNLHTAASRRGM